ncbi:MAG: type II CRISPR RNA-guided endonuclease Cas9 [Treponema sp.]|uniref:type II CRISPR RNA-guided endonuclease Cas9 n=1 Tax=Treponema sp. TaxID=166 RepID=UPI00298EBB89|nr:type II CRISPR RNA-guided endonuclease Cas9 [Treponema sp.]MBR5932418.1 type II CRISPR RNA-guided endonuclease Cas9 [Treponema sp.]
MKYRLGLDLGTNSIGWSIFSLDDENNVIELKDLGVRIFSDGRDPKTKEPLAVARRTARSQRKLIYRRKIRRKQVFRLLLSQSLFPAAKEECLSLKSANPYKLRIKALDEKLEPYELGRALFNLAVRRGFKSNRKDGSREETSEKKTTGEIKSQADMQNALDKAIKESGYRTITEFLYKMQDKNGGTRFTPGRMTYYPTRKMYEDEFNKIRSAQEKYYPTIDWDAIFKAIFYQRPLKAQQRGYCIYEKDKERTFKAMPCAQKLRILQDIGNLAYYDGISKVKKELNDDQDKILYDLFNSKDKVSFDQIRKALNLPETYSFNLEENRDSLIGNPTAVKMRSKNRFGKLWDNIPLEEQDLIVETIITADEDEAVYEVIKKYNLSQEQNDFIVTNTILQSGTTMLCKEVSEKLVKRMEDIADLKYDKAVESLGYVFSDQTIEKCDSLPYYGKILKGSTMGVDSSAPETDPEKRYGKISNPTVHVALNQTRVVVNALIKEYGKPSQIAIELSRDLKNSVAEKAEIARKQNQRAKENIAINESITDLYNKAFPGKTFYPNRNDRLKYRLWQELGLGCKCLYCGKGITASELFTKEIEIEHILPFSRTLLDSESNLTVAHSSCNAFKAERSPYEAFGSNPKGYNWTEIVQRANQLKNTSKKNKFSPTAMETFEKDSSFIQRQLTDNQYIAKAALRYLKCLVEKPSDVWATNGSMTKLLRDKWEMDSILCRKFTEKEVAILGLKPEQIGNYKKNRFDHRHHAVDAVVIGLTDRSLVQKLATKNSHKQNRIEIPEFPIYRNELVDKVKNIVVSFKPDHGAEGKLSKETLLGRIKIHGKETFVCRESIVSLSEKNLDDIVDEKIRAQVKQFVSKHSDEKIDSILTQFSKETGIKKIRCINRVQTPIEITSGLVPRYLAPEDYFAAVVWEIPGDKKTYKAQYIRRNEVERNSKGLNVVKTSVLECGKPHPAAKQICLLHKDDYLEFTDNGKMHLCRIAGYAATNNKLDIRPIHSVSYCADWIYSTNENMLVGYWKPTPSQNWISVNVLFSQLQAHPVTVSPIGHIFRK